MISRCGEKISITPDDLRELVFQTLEAVSGSHVRTRDSFPIPGNTEGDVSNVRKKMASPGAVHAEGWKKVLVLPPDLARLNSAA
jgi:hypothetical protein